MKKSSLEIAHDIVSRHFAYGGQEFLAIRSDIVRALDAQSAELSDEELCNMAAEYHEIVGGSDAYEGFKAGFGKAQAMSYVDWPSGKEIRAASEQARTSDHCRASFVSGVKWLKSRMEKK